jgi:cytochrome P450
MSSEKLPSDDPFREAREGAGVLESRFQGKAIPLILRHKDVRAAAGDWRTFSNDAPFRVPIPSEETLRTVRQLPIETDPPVHAEYRALVDPFFQRPKSPEMMAKVEALVSGLVDDALGRERMEIVREFAIPLQSRALTYLLNVPETEAEVWIGWGTHVFRDGEGRPRGEALEEYIRTKFAQAEAAPDDGFFSALNRAVFQGRALTLEEKVGFANLTFAGGRDTIIQSVAAVIGYLGAHPDRFEALRAKPEMIHPAAEEFFRLTSPLTHIGRVCPHGADVKGVAVAPDERASLCWASANRDAAVFEEPEAFRMDRKPNPHIAFGSGAHTCIGALHARLLVRTLLKTLCEKVGALQILESEDHVEREDAYTRRVGFERLVVSFRSR